MSYIANLLREAADEIEVGEPDRAAWRVADAGGLLRAQLEEVTRPASEGPLAGLEERTGLGYMLPAPVEVSA